MLEELAQRAERTISGSVWRAGLQPGRKRSTTFRLQPLKPKLSTELPRRERHRD